MKNPFVKLSSCFVFVLAVAMSAAAQTENRERIGNATAKAIGTPISDYRR